MIEIIFTKESEITFWKPSRVKKKKRKKKKGAFHGGSSPRLLYYNNFKLRASMIRPQISKLKNNL